jgi:hypothetical protein
MLTYEEVLHSAPLARCHTQWGAQAACVADLLGAHLPDACCSGLIRNGHKTSRVELFHSNRNPTQAWVIQPLNLSREEVQSGRHTRDSARPLCMHCEQVIQHIYVKPARAHIISQRLHTGDDCCSMPVLCCCIQGLTAT